MGKDYNSIGGAKYKKASSKRSGVNPTSSLEEMKLVVRVTKKASDTGGEYYHTFDLEELEVDVDTATISELFSQRGIYGDDFVIETCFRAKKGDESDEDESEDDEEEEKKEDEAESEEDDAANPYRLIYQEAGSSDYDDVDGDFSIKDLLNGGELIITLK
ncbi:hypothetical protein GGI04_005117 [Coemansia thaxteri]|nr:hypothetical protein GGI04_005117 [Coemansia thaxteri]KAJ2464676.1 hypothetical protein GGI02_004923 [Coemansia sp. RSA 2322]KAJ2476690.1 hypothetical protein EV174_004847 [Coemansia sp. RSA 2320]